MANPYKLLLGMSLLREKKRLQTHENATSEGSRFLVIDIANREVLIRQSDIEEVTPAMQITQVPDTKAWFKGLTSFRGNLLPLVDLAVLLGQKSNNSLVNAEVRILVIQSSNGLLGLIVSKVEGIQHHWLYQGDTEASEEYDGDRSIIRYCQFYFRQNKECVPVLDLSKIRNSQELLRA